MTYSGGTYPSVSGQPPHFATQYALAAPISARRASCSDFRRIITTLFGSASANMARTSFPRLHFSQYGFAGFGITLTPRAPAPVVFTERGNSLAVKRDVRPTREFIVTFAARFSRPASEALARPLAVSLRPVPVGAGRVDQVRLPSSNSNTVSGAALFQRGTA